jgi:acyl-CoA synthetase (AMP-forming)/AMP-acid ligase II
MLESQVDQLPGAIAIAAVGRTPLTYSRLCDQINYVVKTLNSMDIGRNDRIALVLPNGPEMAVACIAVAAYATSAPLNPAYRGSEFDSYLTDLNTKALIVQSGVESPAVAVAEKRGIPVLALSPVLDAEAGVFTLVAKAGSRQTPKAFVETGDVVIEDVVLVLHTSGTTSRAKLVPLTEANIYASARHVQAALEITSSDRYLNVMPLFHSQGRFHGAC